MHIAEELNAGTYRRLGSTKWATLVTTYSTLNITYGSDRLPALAGIISALQTLTTDTCYAGLWKKHFLNGLLWYVHGAVRPKVYRAPSWSFASVDGEIAYFIDMHWHDETAAHVAKLVDCEVVPLRNNVLGELKGGHATITGPFTTLEDSPEFQHTSRMEYWNSTIRMGNGSLRDAMARWDFEADSGTKAPILMITSNVGLLIRAVDLDRNRWIRLGIVEVYEETEEETVFESFTPALTEQDYPPCRTITLL